MDKRKEMKEAFNPEKINFVAVIDSLNWCKEVTPVDLVKAVNKINFTIVFFIGICVCACAQLCLTLCNPMDCSMPGFPVHHQLLELAQTHVH